SEVPVWARRFGFDSDRTLAKSALVMGDADNKNAICAPQRELPPQIPIFIGLRLRANSGPRPYHAAGSVSFARFGPANGGKLFPRGEKPNTLRCPVVLDYHSSSSI